MPFIPTTAISAQSFPTDGWLNDTTNTWTYASSTTFTVVGNQTIKFSKGTRIKLTQTSVKYFAVTGSSFAGGNTTVTITGGSDYSLANAAITGNYYSYQANPQGYPLYFNYTPVLATDNANFTLNDGTITGIFSVRGEGQVKVKVNVTFGSSTAVGTGKYYLTDVPAGSYPNEVMGTAYANDSSTNFYGGIVIQLAGRICVSPGNTNIAQWRNDTPFNWASGDTMYWIFEYDL